MKKYIKSQFIYSIALTFISAIVIYNTLADSNIRVFPDSDFYLKLANEYKVIDWITSPRPLFSVAIFYIFSDYIEYFLHFQFVTHLLIVFIFANIVHYSTESKIFSYLAPLYVTTLLTLSIFSLWITSALTETLNTAIIILMYSLFINIIKKPLKWKDVFLFFIINFVFIFYRDSNVFYAFAISLLFSITLFSKKDFKKILTLLTSTIILSLISVSISDKTGNAPYEARWFYSMGNTLGKTIIPNEIAKDFFISKGMPTPALNKLDGNWSHESGISIKSDDKDIKDLQHWIRNHAKKVYLEYLLKNPDYFLLNENFFKTISSNNNSLEIYYSEGYHPLVLDIPIDKISYALITIILIILFNAYLKNKINLKYLLAFFAFNSVAYLSAAICFHADAMEQGRHILFFNLHLYLAPVIGFILITQTKEKLFPRT